MSTMHEKGVNGAVWSLAAFAAAAGMVLFAGMTLFYQDADPFLRRLDRSVGELLMQQGQNAETAENDSSAIAYYRAALAARFEGPHHRAHTQLRLGTLLLESGDAASAVSILRELVQGAYVDADARIRYCAALLATGNTEELDQVLVSWESVAEDDPERAEIAWFQGKLAALEEDDPAATAAYERGVALHPGSRCAIDLAQGDEARRIELLSQFLLHGATGEPAVQARRLLQEASASSAE